MREYVTCMQDTTVALAMIEEGDIPFLRRMANDTATTQYLMRSFPISDAFEKEWVKGLYEGNPPTNLVYLVVAHDTGSPVPIGTRGLHGSDYVNRTATTGTALVPQGRDRGYGTKAKMLLLEYAFYRLNLRIVQSKIFDMNPRSIRVQEKCGYREVARIPNVILRGNAAHDEVIMHCTRESFEAIRTSLAQ